MLVLGVKEGQSVEIHTKDGIVTVQLIAGSRRAGRLGFIAPSQVAIRRPQAARPASDPAQKQEPPHDAAAAP